MRHLVIVLFILGIVFGCNGKQGKIEILPDYDKEYKQLTSLSPDIKILSGAENIKTDEFKSVISGLLGKDNTFSLTRKFIVYINTEGVIDKVKSGNGGLNEADNKIIALMENWKIQPAVENGKKIKFSAGVIVNLEKYEAFLVPVKELSYEPVDEQPMPIGGMQAIGKEIKYPEEAKKQQLQGTVFLELTIDVTGNIIDIKVQKSAGDILDKAAITAMKNIKFTPAKIKGKPVETKVVFPIKYKLQ